MVDKDNKDKEDAGIMMGAVLLGGCQVGFNTNPDAGKQPCFIEINDQKLVCLAQGGECRYNHMYYSPGLGDTKSWTTPIINEDCPNRCCYKTIVCDNHDGKCEGSIEYYPHYNKFNGLFKKYCREFEKFGIKDGMSKKESREEAITKRMRSGRGTRSDDIDYWPGMNK